MKLTLIGTMTLIGLFGLAMHTGYYWAAGGLLALFLALIVAGRLSARRQRAESPTAKTVD